MMVAYSEVDEQNTENDGNNLLRVVSPDVFREIAGVWSGIEAATRDVGAKNPGLHHVLGICRQCCRRMGGKIFTTPHCARTIYTGHIYRN